MSNARQKILQYIREQQTANVDELSKVFGVTPANIRHHLSILAEQGSIKVIGQKPKIGKGRPVQIYASCQQTDQNNLDRLSKALLSTLGRTSDHELRNQWVKQIAHQIGAEFKTDYTNPTRRLYSAIHALNRMSYHAHWEAHLQNPRIMLGHCPYQVILGEHRELCQLDSTLLEQLLGAPVVQVEKQKLNARDIPECVFLINQPTQV